MKNKKLNSLKPKVYIIPQYGHVELMLRQIMDERKITRYALAEATNTRFEVINKWCFGHIDRLDMDVLARICYALDCTANDIIRYIPPDTEENA